MTNDQIACSDGREAAGGCAVSGFVRKHIQRTASMDQPQHGQL